LLRLALAAVGAALFGALAGLAWLRTSLPVESGELAVPGLAAPVTIDRDQRGIPFITVASEHDAYFALGFVHAQDRLFQMDFMHRAAAGRLAEVLGPRALPHDRLMRTLGIYRLAEANLAGLSDPARAALEAYADGVNAYLRAHRGAWPLEYYLLGTRPEPWRPADSLAWGRLMALRLSSNWREELLRTRLAARLTPRQIDDLWPAYPKDAPRGVAALGPSPNASVSARAASSAESIDRGLLAPIFDSVALMLAALPATASASNCFAVDGRHTSSGKPLLANDPHLPLETPGVWYLVRVTAPGLVLAGATAPGVPFFLLGHNGRVAWGMTTTHSDTQDLFLERVDAADPARYLTPEGPRPFELREEVIHVRGAADVRISVRETRHGPVVSDVLQGPIPGVSPDHRGALPDQPGVPVESPAPRSPDYVVALADTALRADDRTGEALYRMNHAADAASFKAALEDFHSPPQNVTFADAGGAIGFVAAGRVPIRAKGDGSAPVPGWTGAYDWTGTIPFAALPQVLNPPSGRIMTANHRIVDDAYPYLLTAHWPPFYRALRLEELLDARTDLDAGAAAAIQRDTVSTAVRDLLPLLLRVPSKGPREARAFALLGAWDGAMDRNRPEPLIYSAWVVALMRAMAADELGPLFDTFRMPDPLFLREILTERQEWCDDVATPEPESCADTVAAAFETALSDLTAKYGADMSAWRWGAAHQAVFVNRILGRVPLLGSWVEPRIETDGDDDTPNRGTYMATYPAAPFTHVHGAGMRAIYDFTDLDRSLFALTPGESGNPLSPHYADTLRGWRDDVYFRLGPAAEGAAGAPKTLVLRPGG
jgi:penicillin amidase